MGGFIKIIEFQELANWKVKGKFVMPNVKHNFYLPCFYYLRLCWLNGQKNDAQTTLYIHMCRTAHDQSIHQHLYWIPLEYKMYLVEKYNCFKKGRSWMIYQAETVQHSFLCCTSPFILCLHFCLFVDILFLFSPSQISLDLCSAAFSYHSTLVFARYHFLCSPMKSHIFLSGSHSLSLTFFPFCQKMKEQISKRWREM